VICIVHYRHHRQWMIVVVALQVRLHWDSWGLVITSISTAAWPCLLKVCLKNAFALGIPSLTSVISFNGVVLKRANVDSWCCYCQFVSHAILPSSSTCPGYSPAKLAHSVALNLKRLVQ
jgi:hypothetical protein